jgi:GR25 family glycosyltransferase involved in LPS biosynthesis
MMYQDYFREINISQVYISSSVQNLKNIFMTNYNLSEYKKNILPTLFVGICMDDIKLIDKHKSLAYLFLMDSDIYRLKMVNSELLKILKKYKFEKLLVLSNDKKKELEKLNFKNITVINLDELNIENRLGFENNTFEIINKIKNIQKNTYLIINTTSSSFLSFDYDKVNNQLLHPKNIIININNSCVNNFSVKNIEEKIKNIKNIYPNLNINYNNGCVIEQFTNLTCLKFTEIQENDIIIFCNNDTLICNKLIFLYEYMYQIYNPDCVFINNSIAFSDNYTGNVDSFHGFSLKIKYIKKLRDFYDRYKKFEIKLWNNIDYVLTLFYKSNRLYACCMNNFNIDLGKNLCFNIDNECYQKINGIDIIYWINLKRSEQRRIHMEKILKYINIPNYRINAIDGDENLEDLYQNNKYNMMTKYEFACVLSHLKTINCAKNMNYKYIMICEDDISFDNLIYFNNDIKNIIKNAPPFDILMLNSGYDKENNVYTDLNKENCIYINWNEMHEKHINIYSTACYIMSNNGINELNKLFNVYDNLIISTTKILDKADIFIYKYVNTYTYKYNFISSINKDSTINDRHLIHLKKNHLTNEQQILKDLVYK